ncbi:CpaF family protein [Faecalimonas canis]
MMQAEQFHGKILERIDLSEGIDDEELTEVIYQVLEEYGEKQYISLQDKVEVGQELFNAFRKLDILQNLIEDETITEIMINGNQNIFIERNGKIILSDKRFISKKKLEDVIQQIVAETNRIVNEAVPIVDTRLSDGSRVNVVLYPIALNGPIVTIRKFPKESITLEKLRQWGALNQEIISFLQILIQSKYNIFISGGTGTGKTTFLNALSQHIPKDERVITIEDNAELQIKELPNLVSLEARMANVEGAGEISIRDLIKTALRMRPDRIIVGEVRGEEVIDMLQAMNTGHDGSLSTGHANSSKDMITRLETMVLMGMDLPLPAIQRQIASGVDILIHLGRFRDKSRKLISIEEVAGCDSEGVRLNMLYQFQETGEKGGRVEGKWVKINEMEKRGKLLAAGYTQKG